MKVGLNVLLGIAAGVINCIIWYLVARSLNFYSFDVDRYRYYATLFLLVFGIFFSIYYLRKNNNGFIEFKDAVKCGIVYTLILSICLGIFNYIYYSFLAPDTVDYFISEVKKTLIGQKAPDADIAKSLEIVKSYYGSFRMFMSTIILGVIVSLILGAVLRKKNPTVPFSAN